MTRTRLDGRLITSKYQVVGPIALGLWIRAEVQNLQWNQVSIKCQS